MNHWMRLCCAGLFSSLLLSCYSDPEKHWSCGQKIDEEYRNETAGKVNEILDIVRRRSRVRWPESLNIKPPYGDPPVTVALYDIRNTNEPLIFNVALNKIALNRRDLFYYREKYCVSETYFGAVWQAKLKYNKPTKVKFDPNGMNGYLTIYANSKTIYRSRELETFEYEFSAGEHLLRVDYVSTHPSYEISLDLDPSPF